jgi:hypothetical protein
VCGSLLDEASHLPHSSKRANSSNKRLATFSIFKIQHTFATMPRTSLLPDRENASVVFCGKLKAYILFVSKLASTTSKQVYLPSQPDVRVGIARHLHFHRSEPAVTPTLSVLEPSLIAVSPFNWDRASIKVASLSLFRDWQDLESPRSRGNKVAEENIFSFCLLVLSGAAVMFSMWRA